MKRVVLAGAGVALAAAGIAGWWMVAHAADDRVVTQASIDADTMRIVPSDVRIKVEVLNASGERGLARRAMSYLRDRGFDVVSVGNATEKRDSSVVFDRSGHPEWATMAVKALGTASTESRPEESRYLDLTIVLGSNFRSPSQILYP